MILFITNYESILKQDFQLKYEIKKSNLNDLVKSFDLDFIKNILDKTYQDNKPKIWEIEETGINSKYKSSYYQNAYKVQYCTFTIKQYNDKKQAKQLFKRFTLKDIY